MYQKSRVSDEFASSWRLDPADKEGRIAEHTH